MNIVDTKALSLVKIAELGSFTQAANELCITQPAISQHIKLLEDEMGVKLITRNRNEIKLTSQGKIAVKYIKRMISISNTMEQMIKDEMTKMTSVCVGITHTVESSAIIEALADYANSHEGIMFKIISDTKENLYKMLKNYELDFLIVEGKFDDSKLKYSMLGTDCLVLVASPGHPLAERTCVGIDEIKNEPMILRLPNSNTRSLLENALREINRKIEDFNIVMEIDNIATIKDLVRRGSGVSILAKSACADEIKKGKLAVLSIDNFSLVREINVVYSSDTEHPELVSGIVQRYNEL